ncbi:hypothetical protein [Bradyrhizobium liaoningense]|uniref:hypothetical protein n=1 Tax=Bradyrhizobium liaoningense TaxID=43992 RepID=UPI001FE9B062|nr:hypothetical protein [Bradyrhizobium liaoningense]
MTTMLLPEPLITTAIEPGLVVPMVAPAATVTLLLPPPERRMPELSEVIAALLRMLIVLFDAVSKPIPGRKVPSRDVAVPSPI